MKLDLEPFPGHFITLLWGHADHLPDRKDIAFVNPELVLSPLQVHVAACRVLAGPLKTGTLARELLYCLSGSTNVPSLLLTFG